MSSDYLHGEPSAESMQIACFLVGREEYALGIMRIKEIINPVPVTPIPRCPAFIEGIIELRGSFLPIVDLRKRFGLPVPPAARENKYIIVGLEGRIVGLMVDKVIEVRRIDVSRINEAPDLAVGADARFFDGVVKWGQRIVMMVNLDEILSRAEKEQLSGMEREKE